MRQEDHMLSLHLGQDVEILVPTRKLWPGKRPERCVFNLVVVVQLILDERPVRAELSSSVLIDSGRPQGRAQSCEVAPKGLVDQIDDGESTARRFSFARRLLLALHGHLPFPEEA
jgi:hypothetical protein